MTRTRTRSIVRRWRIAGVAALIGTAASFAIVSFSDLSAGVDHQSHVLAALASAANGQSANEWQVIAEGSISADLQAEIDERWGRIESAVGELHAAGAEDAASVEELGGLIARYRSAMSEEFDLVATGQLEAAKELDEAQVDPAFEELHALINSLRARFDSQAESARTLALGSSIAILLLAVGVIAVLARRDAGRHATEESEARFRALVQNGSDVTAVVDQAGAMRYVTASVERVLGYRPEELLGRPFVELVHPEDRQIAGDELTGPPGGTSRPVLARLLHRDGSWPWCETIAANLFAEPAVRGIVLTTRDVTEREDLRVDLAHRATHDDLTGLPNRALFSDRLQHALARRPTGNALDRAVLFLDLDRFKTVNDVLGHQAGDDALKEVAVRLTACMRSGDTVARLGGDEFVVLLEDVAGLATVEEIADRILAAVAKPLALGAAEMRLTASLGIAMSRPDVSPEELLREADSAMYSAKRSGAGHWARLG